MIHRLLLSLLLALASAPAAALTPPPEPPEYRDVLYFDWDSTAINPQGAAALERVFEAYAAGRGRIIVSAHADASRSPADAMALSERMANAVRDHLVRLGAEGQSIDIQAFGSQRPAFPAKPGVGEPRNRRVELRVCFNCFQGETAAGPESPPAEPPRPAAALTPPPAERLTDSTIRGGTSTQCVAAAIEAARDLGWTVVEARDGEARVALRNFTQKMILDCGKENRLGATIAFPAGGAAEAKAALRWMFDTVRFQVEPSILSQPGAAASVFRREMTSDPWDGRNLEAMGDGGGCLQQFSTTPAAREYVASRPAGYWSLDWAQVPELPVLDRARREVRVVPSAGSHPLVFPFAGGILAERFYRAARTLALTCSSRVANAATQGAPQ